jgi:hypothetical protein
LHFGAAAFAFAAFKRRLVGDAGNAPVRRFQLYFSTPDLQSSNWIISQKYFPEPGPFVILCPVKIHADKIEGGPPHALSVRDVRLIFATVPLDWTAEIKEVRIVNSLERTSRTYFARYDKCLNIYSRNRTIKQALTAVLSELAAISLHNDHGLRYRSKAVRQQLEKIAAPFLQELLPVMATPRKVDLHTSLEGFKEMHFPPVPNDVE